MRGPLRRSFVVLLLIGWVGQGRLLVDKVGRGMN